MQADLKRRADELEKKTAGVDLLNRKADKIRAAQEGGSETGGAFSISDSWTSQPAYAPQDQDTERRRCWGKSMQRSSGFTQASLWEHMHYI